MEPSMLFTLYLLQVPIPVRPNNQTFRAMKWLMESATEKDRKVRVWDKLAYELLDAYNNEVSGSLSWVVPGSGSCLLGAGSPLSWVPKVGSPC